MVFKWKIKCIYNCIDRHIENGLGEETTLIWQSNDPTISTNVSYNELRKSFIVANGLKRAGIKEISIHLYANDSRQL